jgi:hypothetical protein
VLLLHQTIINVVQYSVILILKITLSLRESAFSLACFSLMILVCTWLVLSMTMPLNIKASLCFFEKESISLSENWDFLKSVLKLQIIGLLFVAFEV